MTEHSLKVLGALALELSPGSTATRVALPQHDAGTLAHLVARDLARFAPAAAGLELVTVGGLYDAVELLRPGWPVHHELDQLAARAPLAANDAAEGRIIAFGAHDDRLPGALAPSPDFQGGPLRLLPFVLGGAPDTAAAVGAAFERDLMERGMAGADTALAAQELFGLQVEHARYLTLHDLLALMAMQYDHAGLAPLWPVIEAALLAPDHVEAIDAPPEPRLAWHDGQAHVALFTPQAWRTHYAPDETDSVQLERRFAMFEARQRQFAAVLGAHGITVTFVHCDEAGCEL